MVTLQTLHDGGLQCEPPENGLNNEKWPLKFYTKPSISSWWFYWDKYIFVNCTNLYTPLQEYVFLIIPVYNRPEEVDELLESLSKSNYNEDFEVVIIEDGSSVKCEDIVRKYESKLTISYYYKDNSGPGDSRNYEMKSQRWLFYHFDSDCIIPAEYLTEVDKVLAKLRGLLLVVLIALLIAFQIYKRQSIFNDFLTEE
jgi:hypothetical protein